MNIYLYLIKLKYFLFINLIRGTDNFRFVIETLMHIYAYSFSSSSSHDDEDDDDDSESLDYVCIHSYN